MAYHELFRDDFLPRGHYRPMWEHIQRAGQRTLAAKTQDARLARWDEGATFRLDADPDTQVRSEGAWSLDILPRIIPSGEWREIEMGLRQRIRALNLFLRDVYHDQRILKDGVIPPELIYRCKDFRREVMDVDPPQGVYTPISAVDLIRDEDGRYLVLEDQLRTPAGTSDMIANRVVGRRILPELFARYRVRPVEDFPNKLLQTLRFLSPRGVDETLAVILTPGVTTAVYFEQGFLAGKMGIELVSGRQLTCKDRKVYLKTSLGLRRVDVVYRCVPDTDLDPLVFRPDSRIGVAGLIDAWRAGNVALVNAPGTGVADDKAVHAYASEIIHYYLGEPPILPSVPTYQMTDHQDRTYVLDNIQEMIVKPVAGTGNDGLPVGPVSTGGQREDLARRIAHDPRNFVAQPLIRVSRHVCYLDGELESRHLDLRPFILYGDGIQVIPGGLTRVATAKGSPVVDWSQGGHSKDTWVLAD